MVKYIIIFLIYFIVLRVVPVLSAIHHPYLKSIPFLYFSRDHLRSTMVITCSRQWGSFAVGDHLRCGTFPSSENSHFQHEAKSKTILVKWVAQKTAKIIMQTLFQVFLTSTPPSHPQTKDENLKNIKNKRSICRSKQWLQIVFF